MSAPGPSRGAGRGCPELCVVPEVPAGIIPMVDTPAGEA
jgi:hypothetical protein